MLGVRLLVTITLLGASLSGVPVLAQTATAPAPASQETYPRELNAEESADLIGKLKRAQDALRRGDNVFFQLLSGAPASYAMTKTSPRDAFLAANFDGAGKIKRLRPTNPSWKPHDLTLPPSASGADSLYCDVRVVLGFYGDISRVMIYCRPPHPF